GIWSFHTRPICSAPALPAGRITALQALDVWKRHFEEKGVTEPEHSSQYIIAHLLGAKTIESVEPQRLTEFLSKEKTEQVWQLCIRRLSRSWLNWCSQICRRILELQRHTKHAWKSVVVLVPFLSVC
ncbi:hypothetical protein XENORESO_017319, partial [Xenotaenia resolanae]